MIRAAETIACGPVYVAMNSSSLMTMRVCANTLLKTVKVVKHVGWSSAYRNKACKIPASKANLVKTGDVAVWRAYNPVGKICSKAVTYEDATASLLLSPKHVRPQVIQSCGSAKVVVSCTTVAAVSPSVLLFRATACRHLSTVSRAKRSNLTKVDIWGLPLRRVVAVVVARAGSISIASSSSSSESETSSAATLAVALLLTRPSHHDASDRPRTSHCVSAKTVGWSRHACKTTGNNVGRGKARCKRTWVGVNRRAAATSGSSAVFVAVAVLLEVVVLWVSVSTTKAKLASSVKRPVAHPTAAKSGWWVVVVVVVVRARICCCKTWYKASPLFREEEE
mmetsp:Transcript_11155/g.22829  ORF Transcript_11155/g.22829 Transcript_11155/m.22829 type:complete len:337 (-) Transcript_11155:929-1939(-)